jgi:hypothetical protein
MTQWRLCVTRFAVKYHRNCLTGLTFADNLVLVINNDFYRNKDALFLEVKPNLCLGRAIAQAVSRWLPTVAAWVRSRV